MEGERAPEVAAQRYVARLRELPRDAQDRPVLDLVLLGLGTDGHTASLFPGTAALAERAREVVAVAPGPPGPPGEPRITLTYPTLAAARSVLFLVSGSSKAEVVRELLERAADVPAQRVSCDGGELTFLLDEDASALLAEETLAAGSAGEPTETRP